MSYDNDIFGVNFEIISSMHLLAPEIVWTRKKITNDWVFENQ